MLHEVDNLPWLSRDGAVTISRYELCNVKKGSFGGKKLHGMRIDCRVEEIFRACSSLKRNLFVIKVTFCVLFELLIFKRVRTTKVYFALIF